MSTSGLDSGLDQGASSLAAFAAAAYPAITHTLRADVSRMSESGGRITFTVYRTGYTGIASTVGWGVTGTVDAADFGGVMPTGIVKFAAGETEKAIVLRPVDDTAVEDDETVIVRLGAVTGNGAELGSPRQATMTLADNDLPPTVSITSAETVEGAAGSSSRVGFVLTRSGNIGGPTDLIWTFSAWSTSADDFAGGVLPTEATLSFAPGVATMTLWIDIAGDAAVEGDEEFIITITPTRFGVAGETRAVGTIRSDDFDNAFNIAATAPTLTEGHSGTQVVEFTVTRSGTSSAPATVNWQRGGTVNADDLAAGTPASGMLSFGIGETSKTLRFEVTGDARTEVDEHLTVTLSGVTGLGAGLGPTPQADTLIVSDDPKYPVTIVATQATVAEGNSGTQRSHSFTLTRSGDLSEAASIPWTAGGSLDAADHAEGKLPSGVASFAVGSATTTISVVTLGDTLFEPDETLQVTLGDGDLVTADTTRGSASVALLNDDEPDEFRIEAVTPALLEGSVPGAKTSFRFELTRLGHVDSPATLRYVVSGSGFHPADPDDFGGSFPTGTVPWAAGETRKTLYIPVLQDTTREADETFTVLLAEGVGAGVSATQGAAQVTVKSDEPLPQLLISARSAVVNEGPGGPTAVSFDIQRRGDSTAAASVDWALGAAGPHGTDGSDFIADQALAGRIGFAAGETLKTLTVLVQGDAQVEFDEGFGVTLTSATGAALVPGDDSASVLVRNDDTLMVFGTAANNEVFSLSLPMLQFAISHDADRDGTRLVGPKDAVANEWTLKDVELLAFTDKTLRLIPGADQLALVRLGQAVQGAKGLDAALYIGGLDALPTLGLPGLAAYAAQAYFGGFSAALMATTVLANLGISAQTLGGPDAPASFQATVTLLASMFGGGADSRGQALTTVVQALAALEGDTTYGAAAAAFNDRIGSEWLSEFAGLPASLVGLPDPWVEVAHP